MLAMMYSADGKPAALWGSEWDPIVPNLSLDAAVRTDVPTTVGYIGGPLFDSKRKLIAVIWSNALGGAVGPSAYTLQDFLAGHIATPPPSPTPLPTATPVLYRGRASDINLRASDLPTWLGSEARPSGGQHGEPGRLYLRRRDNRKPLSGKRG